VQTDGEIERWTLPEGSLAYPLGANGFVFRRADLLAAQKGDLFQDTHVAFRLMQAGQREWLRIRGRGVHHYYVQTLPGFVVKRRRAVVHYLRVRQESKLSWTRAESPVPPWLAGLYCLSVVGPAWHTLRGLLQPRDPRWLWHIPACVGSCLGTAWGYYTHWRHPDEKRIVANLQPRQTLKKR